MRGTRDPQRTDSFFARELRSRRRRPALPAMALNMTPLIDCVFLLLTYFILTLDFRPVEDALTLDAPRRLEGPTPQRQKDEFSLPDRPVVITVRSTGDGSRDYTLATDEPVLGNPADAADLRRRARAARGTTLPASQPFSIRPAADTRWEHTLAAFHALQRAGFTQIILANPAPRTE